MRGLHDRHQLANRRLKGAQKLGDEGLAGRQVGQLLDLLGLLFLACSRQIKNPPCQTTLKGRKDPKSFTSECLGRKLSLLALAPTVYGRKRIIREPFPSPPAGAP